MLQGFKSLEMLAQGDLIAVFVDDEYRGHGIVVNGVVNNSNVLFTSVVVQTNGIQKTISSLKVFHYVTLQRICDNY